MSECVILEILGQPARNNVEVNFDSNYPYDKCLEKN